MTRRSKGTFYSLPGLSKEPENNKVVTTMILRKLILAVTSTLVLSLAAEIIKVIEKKLEPKDNDKDGHKSRTKSKPKSKPATA